MFAGDCSKLGKSRDEINVGGKLRHVAVGVQGEPGARVVAFMHAVIDEQRMAAHGDAQPRRVEIGFGRDRILVIAQMICGIRQQFHQRDAEIRHMPLTPLGQGEGETVEDELAEARVILGEIIDLRRRLRLARAIGSGLAIQVARAIDLEAEVEASVTRIEAGKRPIAGLIVAGACRGSNSWHRCHLLNQAQTIDRKIASPVENDAQAVVQLRIVSAIDLDRQRMDVADASPALDANIFGAQVFRYMAEKMHAKRHLVVGDFEEIDAVPVRIAEQLVTPVFDATGQRDLVHHAASRTNVSERTSPDARSA